ncbi:MAG: hypothetical protein LUD68_05595 [Rikenellaceae bacterium]|nr:hypothetical protein [Rikenellaceae bacterium]
MKRVQPKRIPGAVLLALLISFIAGTTLFTHTHIVDGKLITHSYPYSEAPDTGEHTHTSTEYALIASLSLWLMWAVAVELFFRLFALRAVPRNRYAETLPVNDVRLHLSLRGPPAG